MFNTEETIRDYKQAMTIPSTLIDTYLGASLAIIAFCMCLAICGVMIKEITARIRDGNNEKNDLMKDILRILAVLGVLFCGVSLILAIVKGANFIEFMLSNMPKF